MLKLNDHKSLLVKFQSLLALLLMVVIFSSCAEGFFSTDNFWLVLTQVSVNMCLSVGMTLVILTGGIDLSVGSVLALSGAVMAGLLKNGLELPAFNLFVGVTALGAILTGLLVGSFLGFFNGLMIAFLRIPPFVATLAMMTIARGLTQLWTGGAAITGLGEVFGYVGTDRFAGVPVRVWTCAVMVGIAILVLKKTRFGRYVYAVGGNERAARFSGLNVNRIKLRVYTIAGALSAVGGLIVTSKLDSATPVAGDGYELDSIAAVVIGGTSLSGGKGSVLGTVLGVLIIGVLNSGLIILSVPPFWQKVIKGCVILLAVAIDKLNTKEQ
ncbi:MAG: ribose ABC transporter permease [Phycisphaerae bacterium]|nr:ribose ABC transporter permease [Phycisphaerae bacterium]